MVAPKARDLRAAQGTRLAGIIASWHAHIANPDFALIVSTATLPTLINPEMVGDLARTGIPKTELQIVTRAGPDLLLF